MANRMAASLSLAKKLLLGSACTAALLSPVMVGLLDARPARAQSGAITGQVPSRVKFADSEIRISADDMQQIGDKVRYTGNVILEALNPKGRVVLSARRASDLSGDTVAEGNLKIDRARKSMLLEGVEIDVDGRTFTAEQAIMSGANPSLASFKMETVEVVPTSMSQRLHDSKR